ncbi:hypothetical protein L1987_49663 [Smallanthus sonchifolius]|uniref:Uncharacterized protein n=1 Tax=Smallanthus sonchifolius TaxID=185202 RepID=A0ACB9FVD0_9ASTR|nr:hypothetical protein L1987_49663 [Smallanthus sonchifolius]
MHRDTSTFSSPVDMNPKFPEHEHLKCPRCDSTNTKFCYYNNYNLSQPRHFCKNCRRYWTKGGTLRNIPVGGGTRKITKRSSNSTKRTSTVTPTPPPPPTPLPAQPKPEPVFRSGSSHEVESGYPMGPFGNLLMEGLNFNMVSKSEEDVLIRNPIGGDFGSNFLRLNDNKNENDGWPDLSIFTPGSSFH